jgi:hypothetical protein
MVDPTAFNENDAIKGVRVSFCMTSRSGSVLGENFKALFADLVLNDFGLDGTGLKIGILSDAFDTIKNFGATPGVTDFVTYENDITSGDLPNDVTVLQDVDFAAIDEGRAMAQLIYDVAPGAKLFFHTAFLGQEDFASGIEELAAAGCDVIVDVSTPGTMKSKRVQAELSHFKLFVCFTGRLLL